MHATQRLWLVAADDGWMDDVAVLAEFDLVVELNPVPAALRGADVDGMQHRL